jgi:hypothetical protein
MSARRASLPVLAVRLPRRRTARRAIHSLAGSPAEPFCGIGQPPADASVIGSAGMVTTDIHRRGAVLVRRLRLAPGEATPWHRDMRQRVTVALTGGRLDIEFRDGRPPERVVIPPGTVDWDEPFEQAHRAVNAGETDYEEVVVFFLDHAADDPQPEEP